MLGGPWIGVAVFILIAIGMGWGITQLFKAMSDLKSDMAQQPGDELHHDFDPDRVYLTQRELLLGYTSNGTPTLFPTREDLPANAYGRRSVPTTDEIRAMSAEELEKHDLIGIVERNTPVKFTEVIEDPDNQQARLLLKVQIVDGPYAKAKPVLGMYLEMADTHSQTGLAHYAPRGDLFAPVQSDAPPGPEATHDEP